MSNIFLLDNDEPLINQINIDELYEKKQQRDLIQLKTYNKVLKKVHDKIKIEAKKNQQFCLYIVPEIILNAIQYDNASCIAYLISKLKENGFAVRYTHPNLLIISWAHYIPSYIRNEFKKKTGITVNSFGLVEDSKEEKEVDKDSFNLIDNNFIIKPTDIKDKKKEYTPINTYKPSGNLVYEDDLFDAINSRLNTR